MENKKITLNDKILLFVIAGFVLSLGILIFILPQKDFSESENRYLTRLSAPKLKTVVNGEYAKTLTSFYTDQIPMRKEFTRIYSLFELSLGKREINGVIKLDNRLIARDKKGQPKLPALSKNTVKVNVESKHKLFLNDSSKLELYYKTDHHRTTKGAYLLYVEVCKKLEITPYEESYFKKETVCDDFYGTTFFRSCLPKNAVTPDSIELWRYESDSEIQLKADGKNCGFKGFYDLSKIAGTDKYAVFLGGNYAQVSIKSDQKKPTLLVIKDSFANAVIPFLALHFNIEMLDSRYMTVTEMQRAVDSMNFDHSLFLACEESFVG